MPSHFPHAKKRDAVRLPPIFFLKIRTIVSISLFRLALLSVQSTTGSSLIVKADTTPAVMKNVATI
ncbi:MAG: hypothetical protein Q8P56_06120, partial [Candidatus Uhrbacteria bacterium]|nr:hypothetical protein [Candidatus Uhrbacteria bacterium]